MRYWCQTANMGYSQTDRWHFDPAGGNCDCSSLVIHCLQEAGFDTGSAGYTGDLSRNLTSRGWTRLPADGHPMAGDILLNDADHVAVYLGDGLLAQASISETGGITGTAGDQTNGETNVSPYYDYPWDCYLRYEGETMPTAQEIAEAVWNFEQNGVKCRVGGPVGGARDIGQKRGHRPRHHRGQRGTSRQGETRHAQNHSGRRPVMSNTPNIADHASDTSQDTYRPVFNDTVRTGIYLLSLVCVIVGFGFSRFGDPAIGDYITTAGGILAAGFGVAYNPLRMNAK